MRAITAATTSLLLVAALPSAGATLRLRIDAPQSVVQGEPILLRLVVHNAAGDRQTCLPLFQWGVQITEYGHWPTTAPWRLERREAATWQPYAPRYTAWARYDEPWPPVTPPPPVVLEPGESFETWWDLLWQYLPEPGRYRVTIDVPSLPDRGLPDAISAQPAEFTVEQPTGRDAAAWSGGAGARQRAAQYPLSDWFYFLDDGLAADTLYAPARVYTRLAYHALLCFHPYAEETQDRLLTRARDALAFRGRWPDRQYWPRLEAYVRIVTPLADRPYGRDLADPVIRAALREVQAMPDLEWQQGLVIHIAASVVAARERATGRRPAHQSILRELGYPWYALPAAERRSF